VNAAEHEQADGPAGPTLGLAIIARDEEQTLPALLASVSGCFDQIALLDTGSSDRTVEIFEAWGAAEAASFPGFEARVGRFRWRDDFAAARNAAADLLSTSWCVWADSDDQIRGAERLRALVSEAPADLAGFLAGYVTSSHGAYGIATGYSWRLRAVRAQRGSWRDPVHEELVVDGRLEYIPPETTLWVHGKAPTPATGSHERNLAILRSWLRREPRNPRALHYAGREEAALGNHAAAVSYFERYFEAASWDELTGQVHRRYAISLMQLGRFMEAGEDAREVAAAMPAWPDSYLTLAEVSLELGDFAAAIENAQRVLELGPPRTTLPHVLTDYTARPRMLRARALAATGDDAAATTAAAAALTSLLPDA
jgi:tetratricopeptide (TPR) repeat protein